MASAFKYIANLGKSVAYSTMDKVKETNPTIAAFSEQNAELGKVLFESVKDIKGTVKRGKKFVVESPVGDFAKEYKVSFFRAVRTGKFYDRERSEELSEKISGGLTSLGDDSWDNLLSEIDAGDGGSKKKSSSSTMSADDFNRSKITSSIDKTGSKITNGIAEAVGMTAEYQVEAYKHGVSAQQKHLAAMTDKINLSIAGMNSTIAQLVEFDHQASKIHYDNSAKFYTQMVSKIDTTNKLLGQLLEAQSNLYGGADDNEKKKSNRAKSYSDLTSEGMPDLKEYFNVVKENLNAVTGGILDMNSAFGEGSNMFMAFAENPLKVIPDYFAKQIIPKSIENATKEFNKSLSGMFSGLMLKANDARNNGDTAIIEKLGELLGINMGMKRSIKPSEYKKGPMPWDGEAKMALTRVIPDYLAKILAAQTGTNEKLFDYESGKYIDADDLAETFESVVLKHSDRAASDLISTMKEMMKNIDFKGRKAEYDAIEQGIHDMFLKMFSEGSVIPFGKKNISAYDMGINDSEAAEFIKAMMDNIIEDYDEKNNKFGLGMKSMMLEYTKNIMHEREAVDKYFKNLEEKGNSVQRLLSSNSGYEVGQYQNVKKYGPGRYDYYYPTDVREIDMRKNRNPNLMNNIYLVKDDYGHNVFYYLQRYALEFEKMRTDGVRVAGYYGDGNNLPNSNLPSTNSQYNTDLHYNTLGNIVTRDYYEKLKQRQEDSFNAQEEKKIEKLNKKRKKGDRDAYPIYGYEDIIYNTIGKAESEGSDSNERKAFRAAIATSNQAIREKRLMDEQIKKSEKQQTGLFKLLTGDDDKDTNNVAKFLEGATDLFNKPTEFVAGVIGRVDKRMFEIVFGSDKKDQIDAKSFMGHLLGRLTSVFSNFTGFMKDEVLDPLKETLFGDGDSLKKKVIEFLGEDGTKEFLHKMFDDKWNYIKNAFKDTYGSLFGVDENGAAISPEKYEDSLEKRREELIEKYGKNSAEVEGFDTSVMRNKGALQTKADRIVNDKKYFGKDFVWNANNMEISDKDKYNMARQYSRFRKTGKDKLYNNMYQKAINNGMTPDQAEIYAKDAVKKERKNIVSPYQEAQNKINKQFRDTYHLNGIYDNREEFESLLSSRSSDAQYQIREAEENINYYIQKLEANKRYQESIEKIINGNPDNMDPDKLKEIEKKYEKLLKDERLLRKGLKAATKSYNRIIKESNEDRGAIRRQIQYKEMDATKSTDIKAAFKRANDALKNKRIQANREEMNNQFSIIDSEIARRQGLASSATNSVDAKRHNAEIEKLKATKQKVYEELGQEYDDIIGDTVMTMIQSGRFTEGDFHKKGFHRYIKDGDLDKYMERKRSSLFKKLSDPYAHMTEDEEAELNAQYSSLMRNVNMAKAWSKNSQEGFNGYDNGVSKFARGGMVNRTGLAAVSEGELIIPPEYNPFYTKTSNVHQRLMKEQDAIKNFRDFQNSLYDVNKHRRIAKFAAGTSPSGAQVDSQGNTSGENNSRESETKSSADDAEAAPQRHKPKDQREQEIFTLHEQGFTPEEIGTRLGIKPSNVKKVLKRLTKVTRKQEQWARDQIKAGASKTDVANQLGISIEKLDGILAREQLGAGLGRAGKEFIGGAKSIIEGLGIKEAAQDVVTSLSNTAREMETTEEDKQTLWDTMIDDLKANGKEKYLHSALGGAAIGAGVSLLTGAIGGPILGAAVGAGLDIGVKSEAVQNWLFGEWETDENGNKLYRKGNILSKHMANNIQKYFPDMAKGAVVGGITSILPFVPGGPVAGVVLGSAIGFAKNNDRVREFLFGNDEDEDSGVLSKKKRDFLKKHVPEAILGGTLGAFLLNGPFGVGGGILMGSILGFASGTDKFKDALFGKEDPATGKRKGGIIGAINEGFVKPLTDFGKNFGKKAKEYITKDILKPLAGAIHPLLKQVGLVGSSIGGFFGNLIGKATGSQLGGGAEGLGLRLGNRVRSIGGAVGKTAGLFLSPASKLVAMPFGAVGAVGTHFRNKQIQQGNATYMSALERNTYRDEMDNAVEYEKYKKDEWGFDENNNKVLLHRKGEVKVDPLTGQPIVARNMKYKLFQKTFHRRALNRRHGLGQLRHPIDRNPDKFEEFDRHLVDMSRDDLESMGKALSALGNKQEAGKLREGSIKELDKMFSSGGEFFDKLGGKRSENIMNILRDKHIGDNKRYDQVLDKLNKYHADGILSDDEFVKLKNQFASTYTDYQTYDDMTNDQKGIRDKLYKELGKKFGMTELSDKTIGKYKGLVDQEFKIKDKMSPIEKLDDNQQKRHDEVKKLLEDAVFAIEHINDPDAIADYKRRRANENFKTAGKTKASRFFRGIRRQDGSILQGERRPHPEKEGIWLVTQTGYDENGDPYEYEVEVDKNGYRLDENGNPIAESHEGNVKRGTLLGRAYRKTKSIVKFPFRNAWRKKDDDVYHKLTKKLGDRRASKFEDIREQGEEESDEQYEEYLRNKEAEYDEYLGGNQSKHRNKFTKFLGRHLPGSKHLRRRLKSGEMQEMSKMSTQERLNKKKELAEEKSRTVSDFLGNPIKWVKNAKDEWIQENKSGNKLRNKLAVGFGEKILNPVTNKLGDIATDMKGFFSRFFHIDEEDGWMKKILKIGTGIAGVLTVVGFGPILENYYNKVVKPKSQDFWENKIYPKIAAFIEPIKPTIARAAVGLDRAISTIPTAIERLGDRIGNFIRDIPRLYMDYVLPFWSKGIEWAGKKLEDITENITRFIGKLAPYFIKGLIKGVSHIIFPSDDESEDETTFSGPREFSEIADEISSYKPSSGTDYSFFQDMYHTYLHGDAQSDYDAYQKKKNPWEHRDAQTLASQGYSVQTSRTGNKKDPVEAYYNLEIDNYDELAKGDIASTVNDPRSASSYSMNTQNTSFTVGGIGRSADIYDSDLQMSSSRTYQGSAAQIYNLPSTPSDERVKVSGFDSAYLSGSGSGLRRRFRGSRWSGGASKIVDTSKQIQSTIKNKLEDFNYRDKISNLSNAAKSKAYSAIEKIQGIPQAITDAKYKYKYTAAKKVDREGNSDVDPATPGFVKRSAGINYFDENYITDSGLLLKDAIIEASGLVNDKNNNPIPNIYYDPATGLFTNKPTLAAKNWYISKVRNKEAGVADTLEEAHDERFAKLRTSDGDLAKFYKGTKLNSKKYAGMNIEQVDPKDLITRGKYESYLGSSYFNNGRQYFNGYGFLKNRARNIVTGGIYGGPGGGLLKKYSKAWQAVGKRIPIVGKPIKWAGKVGETVSKLNTKDSKIYSKVAEKIGGREGFVPKAVSKIGGAIKKPFQKISSKFGKTAMEKAATKATTKETEKLMGKGIAKVEKTITEKVMEHGTVSFAKEALEKVGVDVTEAAVKKSFKSGAKRAAKAVGKGIAAAFGLSNPVGWVITGIFVAWDLYTGFKDSVTATTMNISIDQLNAMGGTARMAFKIISALANAISSLAYGIISPGVFFDIFSTPVFSLVGITDEQMEEARKNSRKEMWDYNKEHGTNFNSIEDYNAKDTTWQKILKFFTGHTEGDQGREMEERDTTEVISNLDETFATRHASDRMAEKKKYVTEVMNKVNAGEKKYLKFVGPNDYTTESFGARINKRTQQSQYSIDKNKDKSKKKSGKGTGIGYRYSSNLFNIDAPRSNGNRFGNLVAKGSGLLTNSMDDSLLNIIGERSIVKPKDADDFITNKLYVDVIKNSPKPNFADSIFKKVNNANTADARDANINLLRNEAIGGLKDFGKITVPNIFSANSTKNKNNSITQNDINNFKIVSAWYKYHPEEFKKDYKDDRPWAPALNQGYVGTKADESKGSADDKDRVSNDQLYHLVFAGGNETTVSKTDTASSIDKAIELAKQKSAASIEYQGNIVWTRTGEDDGATTLNSIYIDNITDIDRSCNILNEMIYCTAFVQSGCSWAAAKWTNGATKDKMSVGILQWRGKAAKNLLYNILKADEKDAKDILGNNTLFNIIKKKKEINAEGKDDADIRNAICRLLRNGIQQQIDMAKDDMTKMLRKAQNKWSNPKVIIYWSYINSYVPLIGADILADKSFKRDDSISQFFKRFAKRYSDVYESDMEKYNKLFNLVIASPVTEITFNLDEDKLRSQMTSDFKEESVSKNWLRRLFDTIAAMGRKFFGIDEDEEEGVEASNVNTEAYDALSSEVDASYTDPYTKSQMTNYTLIVNNREFDLETRMKELRNMLNKDKQTAIAMIDSGELMKFVEDIEYTKEWDSYLDLGRNAIAGAKYKKKAAIFLNSDFENSVCNQCIESIDNAEYIEILIADLQSENSANSPKSKFDDLVNKFISYFIYKETSVENAKNLNYISIEDRQTALNSRFGGTFDCAFTKMILVHCKDTIDKIKKCSNKEEVRQTILDSAEEICDIVVNKLNPFKFADDMMNAYEILNNYYRDQYINEIQEGRGYDDKGFKSLVKDSSTGEDYSNETLKSAWDIINNGYMHMGASDSQIKDAYEEFHTRYPYVTGFEAYANPSTATRLTNPFYDYKKVIDSRKNYKDLENTIIKVPGVEKRGFGYDQTSKKAQNEEEEITYNDLAANYFIHNLLGGFPNISEYDGAKVYPYEWAARSIHQTWDPNSKRESATGFDKYINGLYDLTDTNDQKNGKSIFWSPEADKFRDFYLNYWRLQQKNINFDPMTKDNPGNISQTAGLISSGGHGSVDNDYTMSSIPGNNKPFVYGTRVNWNELMRARAIYDMYVDRKARADAGMPLQNGSTIPTDNDILIAARNYKFQENLATELLGENDTENSDYIDRMSRSTYEITSDNVQERLSLANRKGLSRKIHDYMMSHYLSNTYDPGSYIEQATKWDPNKQYYFTEHMDIDSDGGNYIINNKDLISSANYDWIYDGYDAEERNWLQTYYGSNPQNLDYSSYSVDQMKDIINSNYSSTRYSVSSNNVGDATVYDDRGFVVNNNALVDNATDYGPKSSPIGSSTIDNWKFQIASNKESGKGSLINKLLSSGKGSFVSQMDYADKKFSDGESWAQAGCGPAVAAMVLGGQQAPTGKGTLMDITAGIADRYKNSNGVSADYFGDVLGSQGISTDYTTSTSDINSKLNSGQEVILMGQDASNRSKANSSWGPGTHYVKARQGSSRNSIIVDDPELSGPVEYNKNKILGHTKLGIGIGGRGSGLMSKITGFAARGSKKKSDTATQGSSPSANQGISSSITQGSSPSANQGITKVTKKKKKKKKNSTAEAVSNAVSTASGEVSGVKIEVPAEYGTGITYQESNRMGWNAGKLIAASSIENLSGARTINGRYCVSFTPFIASQGVYYYKNTPPPTSTATKSTTCNQDPGWNGRYIDVVFEDGMILPCICCDVKGYDTASDFGYKSNTNWGHNNGKNLVEFVRCISDKSYPHWGDNPGASTKFQDKLKKTGYTDNDGAMLQLYNTSTKTFKKVTAVYVSDTTWFKDNNITKDMRIGGASGTVVGSNVDGTAGEEAGGITDENGKELTGYAAVIKAIKDMGAAWAGDKTVTNNNGENTSTESGSVGGTATSISNQSWVDCVKSVKSYFVNSIKTYSQNAGASLTYNDKTYNVSHRDCSGFVSMCVQVYFDKPGFGTHKSDEFASSSFSALKDLGFTYKPFSWESVSPGDILACNGHAEVFIENSGSNHMVCNWGSPNSKSLQEVLTPSYGGKNHGGFTTIWSPPAAKGSGLLLSARGTALNRSNLNYNKVSKSLYKNAPNSTKNTDSKFKNIRAKGSKIKDFSNYYGNGSSDTKLSDSAINNINDRYKSYYTNIGRSANNKVSKSIDNYISNYSGNGSYSDNNNSYKDNRSAATRLARDLIESSGSISNKSHSGGSSTYKGNSYNRKNTNYNKSTYSGKGANLEDTSLVDSALNASRKYVANNTTIAAKDKTLYTVLYAISTLLAANVNNSSEIHTIVKLLKKLSEGDEKKTIGSKSNSTSTSKAASKKSKSGKGSDVYNKYFGGDSELTNAVINNMSNIQNAASAMSGGGSEGSSEELNILINNLEAICAK